MDAGHEITGFCGCPDARPFWASEESPIELVFYGIKVYWLISLITYNNDSID